MKLDIELRKDNHLYFNRYRSVFGVKVSVEKGMYRSISEMRKNIRNLFESKMITQFIFTDYRNMKVTGNDITGLVLLEYLES
jgi:hypothetical protein